MNKFQRYIEKIVKNLDIDKSDKEELQLEFLDHLNLLKQEYLKQNHSETEAINLAITNFGEERNIKVQFQNAIESPNKVIKLIYIICFIIYSILLISIFLSPFKASSTYISWLNTNTGYSNFNINIIPFKTISEYITNASKYNINIIIHNIVFKPIMFIPLGFILPNIFNRYKNIKKIILIGILISFSIESLQVILNLGFGDIDDIILYSLGTLGGFTLFKLYSKINQLINKNHN